MNSNKNSFATELTLSEISCVSGSGAGGATAGFWTGKFLTHLVAQAGIALVTGVVSIVATPAVGATVGLALEHTIAPVVEVTSNVVALGLGITGAVATGPV